MVREGVGDEGWEISGEEQDSISERVTSIDRERVPYVADFGLGLGTGDRTHFRTLPKRIRTRIEESADRRNGFVVNEVRKEIKKLKTKHAIETEAHRERVEKIAAQQ